MREERSKKEWPVAKVHPLHLPKLILLRLYWIYAAILFVGIMLIIFPFVVMASFFGRIRGGNMIYRLCMIWADVWFFLVFIRIERIYQSTHDPLKPYIFIANHRSWLDAAVVVKAFRQPVRALGKVEVSKVPVFGFIYKKAIVTVDRSNPENRAKSIQILKSIISKGISVLVFPEGTFNLTEKPLKDFYDGAFRVAIETQTAVKPVIFLDADKRLHHSSIFSLNPGRCRIVYLDEIVVEGMELSDLERLKLQAYKAMTEVLERD